MIFSFVLPPRQKRLRGSSFAGSDRRNYDEGLRQRPVVGDRKVDPRLEPLRGQRLEPGQRAAGEFQGRTAARQDRNGGRYEGAPPSAAAA